ncbi:MAG: phosphate signaling complex protein PhoU [Actinomycetes bacterium]
MSVRRITSPAASAERDYVRQQYTSELEQLALQVELMGILVDENLERMRTVLSKGNLSIAEEALRVDDRIDAMNVSLMERSYELLRREAPVASDLRLIVSVLRVTAELERIGDLSLRIAKLAPEHELLTRVPTAFDILETLAGHAVTQYRDALRAWSTLDLALAERVATEPEVALALRHLVEALLSYEGPDAVVVALRTMVAGQALDRIADHSAVLGARVRYLITGDPDHLAAEVR